jgi:hypothetical protein
MIIELKIGNQIELVSLNEEVSSSDAISNRDMDFHRDGSDRDLVIKEPVENRASMIRYMTRKKNIGIYALI